MEVLPDEDTDIHLGFGLKKSLLDEECADSLEAIVV